MNKYTQDFFREQFPGFTLSSNYDNIISNFWHTKELPFVELDITIDTHPTYQWLLENKHLFKKTHTQTSQELNVEEHGFKWFTDVHSHGWLNFRVYGDDLKRDTIIKHGITMPEHFNNAVPGMVLIDLINQLKKTNLPVSRIAILCLEPGGWVQPHMDRVKPGYATMNHVWLPLHDFKPALKVYPYGIIEHKTGRPYLFNQQNFMHSVINTESFSRFVAVLTLDYKNLSVGTWEQIQKSVYEQWFN